MNTETRRSDVTISSLYGVVPMLRRGEQLNRHQIDEIERLLQVLTDEGWSGSIPADHAAALLSDTN